MDRWEVLRHRLARLDAGATRPPASGRVGATLFLLADADDASGGEQGDLELVYTRRRDDLPTHPGQISFAGGRVEEGESIEEAALREAAEEVALDPATVELLGRLPTFFIPPSRYWLAPVVARWRRPHPLAPAEAEVAEVLHVRLSTLRDPSVWRAVRLSASGWSWAWQLDERHLLWGATGLVTTTLLGLLDPDWHGGQDPSGLGADREVQPRDLRDRRVPSDAAPRLPGVPEVVLGDLDGLAGDALDAAALRRGGTAVDAALERAGRAGAEAARRLLDALASGRHGRGIDSAADVLVLAGGGGNGAAGLATAAVLAAGGVPVHVVTTVPPDRLPATAAARAAGLDVGVFQGALPAAGVVVDALVGGGLRGPLRRTPRAVLLAARAHHSAVVALDVPTGFHPVEGLVGDTVAADVTVALTAPRPALIGPGLGPFVGDLHLAVDDPEAPLRRVVVGR